MRRVNLARIAVVAAFALGTGFVLAGQVRAQLLTPSNQVARYQALVRNVQELEAAFVASSSETLRTSAW